MKKTFIKSITLLPLTALLLAGCGNTTTTDAEASKESSVISESVDSATENSTTEESTIESTKEVVESTPKSAEEATTEESTTEELTEPEIQAIAVAEELNLDNELSALVLEDFQIAWNDLEGDKEKFATYVDVIKEDFAKMAEAKVNPSTEESASAYTEEVVMDNAWIDDLYNKLISDDYEAVAEILKDETILEKVDPYKDKAYQNSSYFYRLVTSDGKIVGMKLPNDMSSTSGRAVWYSDNEKTDYGFELTEYGDKQVDYMYNKRTEQWEITWFDGKTRHNPDGSTFELNEGDGYAYWD